MEVAQSSGQYISTCGGITSVLWGINQYCGGYSVLWRDTFSTVGDNSSTCQYCGGYLQYCGGCSVQQGITSVQVEGSFNTVEGIQYIGG